MLLYQCYQRAHVLLASVLEGVAALPRVEVLPEGLNVPNALPEGHFN